ncbi:thioredoxin family protein [Solimicrobium silvestre]|uniref:Thioredoxin-like n=1 Tax=Solimicrobium silvestre TaxID=2099400 RepID=A0A2S9H2G7_9BURK|nr:thioredoxin family protein [Solimicrobium silvestre]PRC94174.1 Thioredoxin-like [Solimicrobium silvestre]
MKKIYLYVVTLTALFISSIAFAATNLPYDETADSAVNIQTALIQAKANKKNVLLIFGANWCKDCVELDRSLKGKSASLIDKKFVVVKIDIGQFDKNLNIANDYGNPIKMGIPAAVLLKPDNTVLYATHGGELANARHMSEQGVYDFFNTITAQRKPIE